MIQYQICSIPVVNHSRGNEKEIQTLQKSLFQELAKVTRLHSVALLPLSLSLSLPQETLLYIPGVRFQEHKGSIKLSNTTDALTINTALNDSRGNDRGGTHAPEVAVVFFHTISRTRSRRITASGSLNN